MQLHPSTAAKLSSGSSFCWLLAGTSKQRCGGIRWQRTGKLRGPNRGAWACARASLSAELDATPAFYSLSQSRIIVTGAELFTRADAFHAGIVTSDFNQVASSLTIQRKLVLHDVPQVELRCDPQ